MVPPAELDGLPAPGVAVDVVGSGPEAEDASVLDGPAVGELVIDEPAIDELGAGEAAFGGPAIVRAFDAEVGRSGAIP